MKNIWILSITEDGPRGQNSRMLRFGGTKKEAKKFMMDIITDNRVHFGWHKEFEFEDDIEERGNQMYALNILKDYTIVYFMVPLSEVEEAKRG